MSTYTELLTRHASNPILVAADWPYPAHVVFNPGAIRLEDGTTLLLCRVEDRRGISHLCAARSANGIDGWHIDAQPTLQPEPENYPEETWGVEDPRITYLPELEQYAVVYTAYSIRGPGVSLALTKDFRAFERVGMIRPPEDKDATLLSLRGQKIETIIKADASGRTTSEDGRAKGVEAALEIAFSEVTVSLEFKGARLVAPLTDQMSPGKSDGEQCQEFIESLGSRHVGVFEVEAARL